MASAVCVISVVPVACRGPFYRSGVSRLSLLLASPLVAVVGRHGLIVIGCCRRGSASSSWVSVVVVASSCLSSGVVVISVSHVGRPPLIISLIVSLIVSLLVLSSRLACREAGRRALFSRPVRFVAWGAVLLAPFGSRGGGSSYPSACLPSRFLRGRCRWHGWSWLLAPSFPWLVRRIHCG